MLQKHNSLTTPKKKTQKNKEKKEKGCILKIKTEDL